MRVSPHHRCDGFTRREVLRAGSLTALGLTVADRSSAPAAAAEAAPQARRCILLWLDGGPSHLETFDPKPDAPAEVRGPFETIQTKLPGVSLCEHLPRTAKLLDKIALLRSMTSPLGEHNLGAHYLLTGYQPTPVLEYPSYGAVLAQVRKGERVLPPNVAVPRSNAMGGAGFLPAACRPFAVGGDPAKANFQVRDLERFAGVTARQITRRQRLLGALDRFSRQVEAAPESSGDPLFAQAFRLVTSPQAKEAFNLEAEPAKVRQRYGRKTLGQSCLLARRLIERGVDFVTVFDRGWDTHENLVLRLQEGYTGAKVGVGLVPTFDLAFSALVEDLDRRGLLDETLIVAMGEFGRTPKLNTAAGRDHWPRVFSVLLAGGGVQGGQVVGQSDAVGESPAERPVTPSDLACTIYTLLGVDPQGMLTTPDARPIAINRDGKLISELV